MGTKEQSSTLDVSVSASTANSSATDNYRNNANTNTAATTSVAAVAPMAVTPQKEEQQLQQQQKQQQPQQQQYAHLPKASTSSQVIIIPATQASTVATNAAKKIRRAFSMPRNPFRWSRKFKTSTAAADNASSAGGSNSAISSCVGGGRGRAGSIVSLSSYEAICKDTNGNAQQQQHGHQHQQQQQQQPQQQREHESNNETGTNADAKMNDRNGKQDNNNIGGGNGNGNGNGGNGGGSNAENGGTNISSNNHRVLRRSSFRKFLNRIAQHVSTTINVGANKHASSSHMISTADRVPPIGSYQWPADQTPGVMGLKNHGNTCFMNAVLQCLSHTDILAEYFVLDQYKADLKRRNKINSRKFGTKGELTEQLANVLKALWTCKNESDHSTSFKAVVDRYGTQFRSSTQQDAQEFLFWLLDKVHEDLNTATKRRYKSVKNTYGRPDEVLAAETLANHIRCNNSFVQAVFQAQFRSSLTCPRCRKQSNTFDPFHCVSVQLPQLTQQTIFVTVVYLKQHPRQVKLGLTVPAGSPIVALREQLRTDTGIASDRMVLVDINKEGFTRVFYDTQPVVTLNGIETIYCIEVPELKAHSVTSTAVVATTTLASTAAPKTSATVASTTSTNQQLAATGAAKGLSNNTTPATSELLLLVANVRKKRKETVTEKAVNDSEVVGQPVSAEEVLLDERFGTPFSMKAPRDCSYTELQKRLLREMSPLLKPEVFSYATPLTEMFQIRLQDPSADPDTYLENCEHPLLTEMIDLALSVLSAEAGPPHIKLLLEWPEPEQHFVDLTDVVVEHESVARLLTSKPNDTATLTLEQCLEHYTKAETLSAEDAWRCPHCQQYLPVVKTLGLWSLPDILVVHFKRFRQHHEKGSNAAKLTTMVKFPLMAFDMSPHLARGFTDPDNTHESFSEKMMSSAAQHYRPIPWKKTRTNDSRSSTLNSRDNLETRYDLYAVCYHQGDTLETGHYTAACKNPYDRQWYKFDDQRVSKVPHENIQEEIINNEAYMLFYQRRSSDNAECSGSSSTSGDHWVSRIAPPPAAAVAATSTQQATGQKLIVTNVKTEAAVEVDVNAIVAEHAPEKIETKPVEIPKVKDAVNNGEIKDDAPANVAPMDTLAQVVVTVEKTDENVLVDIEELDFADAGVDADDGDDVKKVDDHRDTIDERAADDDELHALEKLGANGAISINDTEDSNHIFIMDEDTPLISNAADADENKLMIHLDAPTKSMKLSPTTARTAETTTAAKTTPTVLATATTNGYKHEKSISPNTTATTTATLSTSNGSIAASSSSSSSLSSRSSPHSLAVSIHGASTLQNKFNGFSSTVNGGGNYKETLLSSSLKSNSSSIIGGSGGASAVIAAHSHDTFHHVSHHQHNQWNGSRSSVSAVENATSTHQTQQTHTHCLNLRHSFSTSSNYKLRECSETLSSMLRNSANTCSKDTLIFIDQQQHHHHHHHSLMEDEDDTFMGSRSLWISPVTPHKLITVSPKN